MIRARGLFAVLLLFSGVSWADGLKCARAFQRVRPMALGQVRQDVKPLRTVKGEFCYLVEKDGRSARFSFRPDGRAKALETPALAVVQDRTSASSSTFMGTTSDYDGQGRGRAISLLVETGTIKGKDPAIFVGAAITSFAERVEYGVSVIFEPKQTISVNADGKFVVVK